ncbi:MAG: 50S ribosomal protein L6 [Candidatus Omnitrophota bacterium]
MSRIGKKPIEVPKDVKVGLKDGLVTVEGPKGKLEFALPDQISCQQKDSQLLLSAGNMLKKTRALFGTSRALVANMIIGVTAGYAKTLLINGVGYKAQLQGKLLKMNLGFSHPVEYAVPEGIKIDASKQVEIVVSGIDKIKVGQVAAEIRRIFPVEPYKGKGIRYKDEKVRRKVGKAVTK